jgi:hypothetical protein
MNMLQETDARRRFIALIREKRTEHFEKDSTDEERILEDVVAADDKLWKLMHPVLARDAALDLVRRVVKGTKIAYDGPQPKLFEDLPLRIATQDGGWRAMEKASIKELRWFTTWYELRLQGTLKRTERDTEILEKLQHLTKVVERRAGNNDEITVAEALALLERRAGR